MLGEDKIHLPRVCLAVFRAENGKVEDEIEVAVIIFNFRAHRGMREFVYNRGMQLKLRLQMDYVGARGLENVVPGEGFPLEGLHTISIPIADEGSKARAFSTLLT